MGVLVDIEGHFMLKNRGGVVSGWQARKQFAYANNAEETLHRLIGCWDCTTKDKEQRLLLEEQRPRRLNCHVWDKVQNGLWSKETDCLQIQLSDDDAKVLLGEGGVWAHIHQLSMKEIIWQNG